MSARSWRSERRRGARTSIESERAEPAREPLRRFVAERAVRPLAVVVLPPDLDDLARSTLLSPREFANALAMLELRGELVINDGAMVSLQAS